MSDNLSVAAALTIYNVTYFHRLTAEFCDYLGQYKTWSLREKKENGRFRTRRNGKE